MFEFLKSIVPYITPVFVISAMLNVGDRDADVRRKAVESRSQGNNGNGLI